MNDRFLTIPAKPVEGETLYALALKQARKDLAAIPLSLRVKHEIERQRQKPGN